MFAASRSARKRRLAGESILRLLIARHTAEDDAMSLKALSLMMSALIKEHLETLTPTPRVLEIWVQSMPQPPQLSSEVVVSRHSYPSDPLTKSAVRWRVMLLWEVDAKEAVPAKGQALVILGLETHKRSRRATHVSPVGHKLSSFASLRFLGACDAFKMHCPELRT